MDDQAIPAWAEALPDDLRDSPTVRATPDTETLARRLVDLDRYKGRSLALPKDGDEASAAAFAESVARFGFIPGVVPEDPSGYDLPDLTPEAAEMLHKLGITRQQAERLVQQDLERGEQLRAQLEEELGEGALEAIEKAAQKFGVNPASQESVARLLYSLSQSMSVGEDGTRVSPAASAGFGSSISALKEKVVDLNSRLTSMKGWEPNYEELLATKQATLRTIDSLMGRPTLPSGRVRRAVN